MSFTLHSQLAADCFTIGELPICRVLLMNNANFPWLILVPKRENMRELFDLAPQDYLEVMEEVRMVAKRFHAITNADKINIAALGNAVPQLHIHIIARHIGDEAWPNPVWNASVTPVPYNGGNAVILGEKIEKILQDINITKM